MFWLTFGQIIRVLEKKQSISKARVLYPTTYMTRLLTLGFLLSLFYITRFLEFNTSILTSGQMLKKLKI